MGNVFEDSVLPADAVKKLNEQFEQVMEEKEDKEQKTDLNITYRLPLYLDEPCECGLKKRMYCNCGSSKDD